MSDDGARDAGFDDWLDALESGDPYYLACENGHGSLPPRTVCPDCGSDAIERESLSIDGVVESVTVVHVPTPAFADDAPYATAIVDLGPVRVTGRVVDADPDTVDIGMPVTLSTTETVTTGERQVAFEPR
ncbi:Zn-ribbon domain-containing OB-fold protein [Halovivax limisalsi]|uniref:Zn-ribbon domain-containing OB-fold protein n=1 Tax=Halovivax limisalsi TaxID=1453760 RepID=UPI001FFDAE19|nr:OB-fold domain-containing protein [Halovivax limisalsi]